MMDKSLTELRGIASALGISNVFQMEKMHLVQEIELRTASIAKPVVEAIPLPAYDARLMTKPPARVCDKELILEYLAPYIERGLRVEFDEERWYMSLGKKTDEGTLRMRPHTVIHCAKRIMK